MLEQYFRRRHVRHRLACNVLGSALVDLADHLARRGHPGATIQAYLQAAEHFGRWLRRRGATATDVTPATVHQFLVRHLPHCRCPPPRVRQVVAVRAALRHLLTVVAPPTDRGAPARPPYGAVASAFATHLHDTCGLAPSTCHGHLRYVREFLAAQFGTGTVDLHALALSDVVAFVTTRAAGRTPGTANAIANALRSFLRYLQLQGIGAPHRDAGVPRAAVWRLATLPRVLTEAELQAFLAAFDRTTATGRRDYAIALCFTALGLRVGDVAALTLDDVDWRAQTLLLAPGKARQAAALPLPAHVAAALAAYLRDGRPTTTSRVLFVHHRAPRGQPLGASGVRSAMRTGYGHAGFGRRFTGTHVLRHTVATRLLRAGASLKEIADVLRHRHLDTSARYAKVDLGALADAALPWPEGTP